MRNVQTLTKTRVSTRTVVLAVVAVAALGAGAVYIVVSSLLPQLEQIPAGQNLAMSSETPYFRQILLGENSVYQYNPLLADDWRSTTADFYGTGKLPATFEPRVGYYFPTVTTGDDFGLHVWGYDGSTLKLYIYSSTAKTWTDEATLPAASRMISATQIPTNFIPTAGYYFPAVGSTTANDFRLHLWGTVSGALKLYVFNPTKAVGSQWTDEMTFNPRSIGTADGQIPPTFFPTGGFYYNMAGTPEIYVFGHIKTSQSPVMIPLKVYAYDFTNKKYVDKSSTWIGLSSGQLYDSLMISAAYSTKTGKYPTIFGSYNMCGGSVPGSCSVFVTTNTRRSFTYNGTGWVLNDLIGSTAGKIPSAFVPVYLDLNKATNLFYTTAAASASYKPIVGFFFPDRLGNGVCDSGETFPAEFACVNSATVPAACGAFLDGTPNCTDTDYPDRSYPPNVNLISRYGQAPQIAGTVTSLPSGQLQSDYCINEDTLREYYCESNIKFYAVSPNASCSPYTQRKGFATAKYLDVSCSGVLGTNYYCKNGACTNIDDRVKTGSRITLNYRGVFLKINRPCAAFECIERGLNANYPTGEIPGVSVGSNSVFTVTKSAPGSNNDDNIVRDGDNVTLKDNNGAIIRLRDKDLKFQAEPITTLKQYNIAAAKYEDANVADTDQFKVKKVDTSQTTVVNKGDKIYLQVTDSDGKVYDVAYLPYGLTNQMTARDLSSDPATLRPRFSHLLVGDDTGKYCTACDLMKSFGEVCASNLNCLSGKCNLTSHTCYAPTPVYDGFCNADAFEDINTEPACPLTANTEIYLWTDTPDDTDKKFISNLAGDMEHLYLKGNIPYNNGYGVNDPLAKKFLFRECTKLSNADDKSVIMGDGCYYLFARRMPDNTGDNQVIVYYTGDNHSMLPYKNGTGVQLKVKRLNGATGTIDKNSTFYLVENNTPANSIYWLAKDSPVQYYLYPKTNFSLTDKEYYKFGIMRADDIRQ